MLIWEAFIYNEQEFPSQVGLDIAVPWRVLPGDLFFLALLFLVACFARGSNLSL